MPRACGGYYRRHANAIEYWFRAGDYEDGNPCDGAVTEHPMRGFKPAVLKAINKIRKHNKRRAR